MRNGAQTVWRAQARMVNCLRTCLVKRLLSNLFIVVFGLALGLLLGEGLARAMYRGPWYEQLVAEQLGGDWTAGVWHNALGLRDKDYATPKPPNTRRVLFLGDSFTYGS